MKEATHPEYHTINVKLVDGTIVQMRSTWGAEGDTLSLDIDPSVPVIIHTAYPGYAENFLSWAADAYVEKSADIDALLNAIEDAVSRVTH